MSREAADAQVRKASEVLFASRDMPHGSPGRSAAERIARAYLAEAAAFISADVVPTAEGKTQFGRRVNGNADRDE